MSGKIAINAASNESNVELQRKLYAELADILAVDVGNQQLSGTFLQLCPAGGVLLDPNLDFSKLMDRALVINNLADVIVREGWIVGTKPGTMSAIYKRILDDHETPAFRLTPNQEAEFKKIDSSLYYFRQGRRTPTVLLSRFRDAEDGLADAINQVEVFKKENPGDPVPRKLLTALKRATDVYNSDAQGPTVQHMLDRHLELQNSRGGTWMSDLRQVWDGNYNDSAQFAEAQFYPQYAQWFKSEVTWSHMKITLRDLESRQHNSETSYGAGLSADWGLWSVGGKYSTDVKQEFKQTESTGLELEFDVLSVGLRFPWMDFGLFGSHAWRWAQTAQYYGIPVSDGQYDASLPSAKAELIPLVPTRLLVARNVKIKADWKFDINEMFDKVEQGGGSVSWGPFSFGGRYFNHDHSEHKIERENGNEVSFKDPQLIGYMCYQVPLCPSPNLQLPWPDSKGLAVLYPDRSAASPLLVVAEKVLRSAE